MAFRALRGDEGGQVRWRAGRLAQQHRAHVHLCLCVEPGRQRADKIGIGVASHRCLAAERLHEGALLSIAEAQVAQLELRPPRSALDQRQAAGVADDLAHPRVAEEMRMDRCRLADGALA